MPLPQVNKIECLMDAIAHLNGWGNPESLCYRLRNPLLLKSFAKPGKHEVDEDGHRMFCSELAGTKASIFDLQLKLSGKSRAGLKPTDAVENLCRVYGISHKQAQEKVQSFLRRALDDTTISLKTPLSYFIDGEKK